MNTTSQPLISDFKIKEEENEHEEESQIITPLDATESEIEKIRIRKLQFDNNYKRNSNNIFTHGLIDTENQSDSVTGINLSSIEN